MTAQRARALAALKASDRRLARLIDATEPIDLKAWRRARPMGHPFSVLVYSIIGQQISGFAARAIAGRLLERFGGRMPSPAEVLAMDPADLKAIGFSGRKVEYVRQRLYRLDHLPSPREVEAIGEKWRPNRSLASFYLWASRPTVTSPTVASTL